MPPLGRRLLIVLKRHEHMAGFVHFFRPKIQGLFKDFQGPNLEISRTSFLFTSKNLPMEIV